MVENCPRVGCLWGLWQMGALGLETILISDVGDGVGHSISSYVGELATNSDGLVLRSGVPEFSLLLGAGSITGLIARRRRGWLVGLLRWWIILEQ